MHNEKAIGATAGAITHVGDDQPSLAKDGKVKVASFQMKAIAFVLAVIALSWFFEGWREVQKGPTLLHCAVLFAGTTATLLMLGVQGYWIYIEEKLKGTLKKRIGLFERIY